MLAICSALLAIGLIPHSASAQSFPFSFTFTSTWGSEGSREGQFESPFGIDVAVNAGGPYAIFVADTDNQRIQRFSLSGDFELMWGYGVRTGANVFEVCPLPGSPPPPGGCRSGLPGSGDGQFDYPHALASDGNGNVYVLDTFGNDRVQKFNGQTGAFLTKWGQFGSDDGEFSTALGIATDNVGNVYVGDTFNHRIQKFDSNGNFLDKWGSFGSGPGELDQPYGLAVSPNRPFTGDVYVADVGNDRVQRFAPDGDFIDAWGGQGTGDGQFDGPWDVAISRVPKDQTRVFVSDGGYGRVQVFDLTGSFLTKFGKPGAFDGQLFLPRGLDTTSDKQGDDRNQEVYVVDAFNRVQRFSSTPIADKVEGSATAKKTQKQKGKRVVIKAKVKAQENLEAKATGKVKVNPSYKLKAQTKSVASAKSKTLKLKPTKSKDAKKIAKALKQGKKATAKLKVKLRDEAGNTKTTKLSVRLKR